MRGQRVQMAHLVHTSAGVFVEHSILLAPIGMCVQSSTIRACRIAIVTIVIVIVVCKRECMPSLGARMRAIVRGNDPSMPTLIGRRNAARRPCVPGMEMRQGDSCVPMLIGCRKG
ncbi:hypothetical protein CALVIDRAFT_127013 [Calocera viscosa TUFC12733]|uniref:Uncharacterized protein n=1 Tax=Calocera viscosa (strain TUFC12733) TaxID=1330018 RepID=A0A167RRP3_CALVF|nr:hypothetical protein CALVIDRAFT_127013 [Calocera viscosa TUFC12733]